MQQPHKILETILDTGPAIVSVITGTVTSMALQSFMDHAIGSAFVILNVAGSFLLTKWLRDRFDKRK